MFPFVFVVIACGAASGFHSLVASGTTAKQLDRETHARPIGYGGMIGESLLGLAAVLACTAGFVSPEAWSGHYASWEAAQGLASTMGAFIEGCTRFVMQTGVPVQGARTLVAVVVVSFALTTLDSATRLLRYNVEEIGESLGASGLARRSVSSSVAIVAIAFFAFYRVDGRAAGLALWKLFGSTNQLLAGLALLVVSLYLVQRGRASAPYLIPMMFMMVSTLVAMTTELTGFAREGNLVLLFVGCAIAATGVWLAIEAVVAIARYRSRAKVASLDFDSR
jgi:carbon starvation protein